MHQPEGGSRERGGSFAAPNDRTTSSTSNKENDMQSKAINSSPDKEALDDSSSRNRITDQCVPDRLYCSPPSRPRQGTRSEAILPVNTPIVQPGQSLTFSSRGSHLEPPVTKATLAELDVPRIVLNPKLRHDVNFDPDLHFRPNLDGEKGKKKLKRANEFWSMLKVQMQDFMQDPASFQLQHADKEWCLPSTLRAIGDILETLVPPEDRSAVATIMNVDMLMQQLGKGVADLESLAEWLAKTLKQHCAPMRDDWVNEMVLQLCKGNQDGDVGQIAIGLQTLMGVLEAMKLDVANHQIRCLRPLLVQDTVDFEQSFFMKKIASRKVDVTYAHAWLRRASTHPRALIYPYNHVSLDLETFVTAFTTCLAPSHATEKIPDTFQFDEERIVKLRADMLEAINIEVCMQLFRKVFVESQILTDTQLPLHCQEQHHQVQQNSPFSYASSSGCSTPSTDEETPCYSVPLTTDVHTRVQAGFMATERAQPRFSDTMTLQARASPIQSLCSLSPASSRSTTPFSSQDSPQVSSSLQHLRVFQQVRPNEVQEATLLAQLNALLEDATPTSPAPLSSASRSRWSKATPSLALAILHATSHPITSYTTLLPHLETYLLSAINTPLSQPFAHAEQSVLHAMHPIALHTIKSLVPLNNTRVFEISALPKGKPMIEKLLKDGLALCSQEQRRIGSREHVSDIIRGLSHVAALHWKVWHPLCYTINPDAPKRCPTPEIEMGGMDSSSAVSPSQSSTTRDREIEKRRRDRERESRRSHLKRRSPDRSPTP